MSHPSISVQRKLTQKTKADGSLLPRFVTLLEFKALEKAAGWRSRDGLLLRLLYFFGLTVKEIRSVRVSHFKRKGYSEGILVIVAKSKHKQRAFKIKKETWQLINDHVRREKLETDDFLFRSKKGNPVNVEGSPENEIRASISSRQIRGIVKRYAMDAGIPNPDAISPTTLRYGFAVLVITINKKPPIYVERLMGVRHDPRRVRMLIAMARSVKDSGKQNDYRPGSWSTHGRKKR